MKGNPADSQMRAAEKRHGIEITSISRPIRPSDFSEFDLILAMDKKNRGDVHAQHIIFIILLVFFNYYELVFYDLLLKQCSTLNRGLLHDVYFQSL